MKYRSIFFILFSLLINAEANAVSANAKNKYPYPLLTNDYGILNENDLGAFTWGAIGFEEIIKYDFFFISSY